MKKSAIALTTLALLLGACSDNAADQAGGAASASGEAGAPVTGVGEVTPEISGEGGPIIPTKTGKDTLVLMRLSDIPTLDPGQSYDTESGEILENVYETLVTYKGSSITDLEGLLATDWETNDEGTEYRFNLRPNVTFHTGNPFTCADAEYTFRRNLVTNNSDSGNWFLAESLLGTGSNASSDDSVTWDAITNAVKCDGETLVFNLPKVDPAFIAKLVYSGQSIVDSKHAKEIGEWDGTEATWKDWVGKDLTGSALAKSPSGTGAYKLVSKDSNDASFEAFDQYWGGAPAIKHIVRRLIPEEATRIQTFLAGDADMGPIGGREIVEAQVKGQPGVIVQDGIENAGTFGFTMNPNVGKDSPNIGSGKWGDGVPPDFFSDANMRKCFSSAMDYQAYIDQYLMGKGYMLNFLLPRKFLGYDASIPTPTTDLAAAEEACKVAHGGEAWDKGFTLTVVIEQNAQPLQVFTEILKTNLESMNPKFKINVLEKPWSEIVTAKDIPMQRVGWAPDYADPDNYVRTLYYSKGYYAGKSGINDPEIDQWIDEAVSTTDEAKRKELYSKIAKKASDENYYLIIPNGIGMVVNHNDLQGRSIDTYNPMLGGNWHWKDFSKTE